ncbi:MAG: SRPBCC domain-containing protein [Planctomycetes bacterium]|nr:SRPBCC domain-containing protein [Planctomycetota bacterium]MCB9871752.1 SRPBCC domain-containing protein [Planctomycetota bacterium]
MKGIHLERTYPHPIERVWQAIATSRGLAAWLMPNDFEPQPGHRFQFRWKKVPGWRGIVDCEVLEIEPLERLVFSWRGEEGHQPTRVTFTLTRVPEGTRLTLDHDGFRGFGGFLSRQMMRGGWRTKLLQRQLPHALESLATGGTAALTPLVP